MCLKSKPAIDDVPKETAACYLASVFENIGLQTFPTVEDIFMLAQYMLIYISVNGGFEAPDRNGKTFVPRFTLSRDKPDVVVTETCQNTPIYECLFTYGFSKQYSTVSEYSNELRAALCSLSSRGNVVIFALIAAKSCEANSLQNSHLLHASTKMANHRFTSEPLAPKSRENTRAAAQRFQKCRVQIFRKCSSADI